MDSTLDSESNVSEFKSQQNLMPFNISFTLFSLIPLLYCFPLRQIYFIWNESFLIPCISREEKGEEILVKMGQRGSWLNLDMMLVPVTFLVSCAGIIFQHAGKSINKAILMFKTNNELTPHYLHELFESRSTGYNLRASELENTLFVRKIANEL